MLAFEEFSASTNADALVTWLLFNCPHVLSTRQDPPLQGMLADLEPLIWTQVASCCRENLEETSNKHMELTLIQVATVDSVVSRKPMELLAGSLQRHGAYQSVHA